jgi:hypothetical protein
MDGDVQQTAYCIMGLLAAGAAGASGVYDYALKAADWLYSMQQPAYSYLGAGTGSNGGWPEANGDGTFSEYSEVDSEALLALCSCLAQLTVVSPYGAPNPAVGLHTYFVGTSVTAQVTSPWPTGATGTRYRCTGWTGTGVVGSGTGTSVTFTLTQDPTITWNWQKQYQLTVNTAHGTGSGAGWYDANTLATFSVTPTTIPQGTEIYAFTGWSSSDPNGYTGSASSQSVTMSNPITETAQWVLRSPGPSVGGEWTPITMQALTPTSALPLLAPWIALALIAAASAVAAYKRLLRKHW